MLKSIICLFIQRKILFMDYSKFQKYISSLLIFALLFSITFRIPFYDFKTFAWNDEFFNLVSIIVDQDTYNETKSQIERYSKDIQWVLENTKVVIFPTPADTSAFKISSLNESLFYEWYRGVDKKADFESKLVWTVLIGELDLPMIYNGEIFSRSILPITDFDDKLYIYNNITSRYEKNSDNKNGLKSEIWHWVISPNLWDTNKNIEWLKDYFAKNHDFYEWTWIFKYSDWILNWNNSQWVPSTYEPYVFYYDQFREEKALNYDSYQSYEWYLENKEDILYSRFNKELTEKISNKSVSNSNSTILELIKKVDPNFDTNTYSNTPSTYGVPDIQTRLIVNNVTKKFIEIFSKWTLWDFISDVHNAWRYNKTGWDVNVDTVPYFITVLDQVNDEILKDVNDELEKQTDEIVKKGLSRNIALPTKIIDKETCELGWLSDDWTRLIYPNNVDPSKEECFDTYINHLYWNNSESIKLASQCSIYRGSNMGFWTLVEASRWTNINLTKNDYDLLSKESWWNECLNNLSSWSSTYWFWGGASPLNLDMDKLQKTWVDLVIKNHDYKWAIFPIFDIWWSVKINDSSKINSPLNCLENNYLMAEDNAKVLVNGGVGNSAWSLYDCDTKYRIPTYWLRENWLCTNTNTSNKFVYTWSFDDNYKDPDGSIKLNWNLILDLRDENSTWGTLNNYWVNIVSSCNWDRKLTDSENKQKEQEKKQNLTFEYKTIPSYLEHKSPTSDELSKEIETMTTPSLPIDKVRYIDFISAKWTYAKLKYPNLFTISINETTEFSYNTIDQNIKKLLDTYSKYINDSIIENNPDVLIWKNKEIYELLKLGNYPSPTVDLYKILKDKKDQTLTVLGDSKTLSYYDTLVFSIYWNNLKSVSAKYWFVFNDYLSDQFLEQDSNYFLPKNKKEYEIAYLWAEWDAQNMYIKMDPKAKANNPYSDIYSENINLSSTIFWSNIWGDSWENSWWNVSWDSWLVEWWDDSLSVLDDKDSAFECSPPDWVPIWEWIPAIMCRLKDMLPPTISISDWECWQSILSDSDDYEEESYYEEDSNFKDEADSEYYSWNNSKNYSDKTVWWSFLTKEEKKEVLECNWDIDKNWINDCIEKNLKWWILDLSSDSEKYYYNSQAKLKATILDKNWNIIRIDNSNDVNFELVKIEEIINSSNEFVESNTKLVYDIDKKNEVDESNIKDYINFTNWKVRSQFWIANYWVWLKSKNSNIYVRAYIKIKDSNGKDSIFLKSKLLKIQIRWDRLFSFAYKLTNTNNGLLTETWVNSLKASDKTNLFLVDWMSNKIETVSNLVSSSSLSDEKLLLFLENISSNWIKTPISFPLKVSVKQDWNNIIEDIEILQDDLKTFKPLLWIKKSWSYSIEIIDGNWYKTIKNIELLPDLPNSVSMTLWSSLMQSWWNVSTNFITIYDKFLNPVIWKYYNLKFSINWKAIKFLENWSDNLSKTTYEWYKVFRLISNENIWNNEIKIIVSDDDWKELITTSKTIKVINDINLTFKPISWDIKVWWWKYKFEVSMRDSAWNILKDFDSRVYLAADPIFLKATNSYFELKNWVAEVEFITKTISWKNIPIEFQVEWLKSIVQKSITIYPDLPMKLDLILSQNEAEASETSYSILYVELKDRYNNVVINDNSTVTKLEILEDYSGVVKSDKTTSTIKEGTTSYKILWTLNPWVAYLKVSTDPSLQLNSYTVKNWESEVVVKWVWENATKIETFYLWWKDKFEGKKYNSIYTTLLGSNYWDIYEKDYLAWSLLFKRDNKALAITSQLNNPYAYNNILDLNYSGWLKTLYEKNQLSQDIKITTNFINNKLALSIYNNALNIYVWKIFYNFWDNTILNVCDKTIDLCISDDKTSISLNSKSDNYNAYLDGWKLIFRDIYWKNLFEISKDWKVNRLWSVEFDLNKDNNSKYLSINVKTWWKIIWELWYNFVNSTVITSRDETKFNSNIDNSDNSILILLKSSSYWTQNNWNIKNQSKVFYYNDPFASENKLNSFSSDNLYWVENFIKQKWIWWRDWNKSLLSFASWKSVWESVQDYMSFSVINLWDPVISLKEIKQKLPKTQTDRNFDSTIWKLLSTDNDINSYQVLDYNNDWRKDIILVKDNNFIKLLENKNVENQLIDMWNLAYIEDLWSKDLVKAWDFTWDNYDDIFFVSNKWKPFLLNNTEKNYTRISLEDNFSQAWRVVRADKFDMDNDWVDDIVTLDDSWWINIFYWWWTSNLPRFTKKNISTEQWIKLDNNIRNDWAIIYFDWLYQPSWPGSVNSQVDSYLFVKYPYWNDYSDIDEWYLDWSIEPPTDRWNKYFVKSEYSEYSWLKVEKKYLDKNGGFMFSDDILKVEVTLKNTSSSLLKNVVIADKISNVFELDKNSFESNIDFSIKDGNSWYNYLIEKLNIPINWSITFTYEVKVRPLKYSYLEVWQFETWEVWNDLYWDIIVKPNNQNCSDATELYRSTNTRLYLKWTKAPVCDESKLKLPDELWRNLEDENKNSVPDYIDRMTNPDDTSELLDFSEKELDSMNEDDDNDGIPNDEDWFNFDWSVILNMWELWENIDWALDKIGSIIDWLSCWFGNASCFASPLNWAPLAPWSDPVFMWKLIWDWLKIGEWIPIFSMLTWIWGWNYCYPSVWPISPLSTGCATNWAGGMLWIYNPTNFFRLFITPTLTWGVWTAICFWAPASVVWNSVPMWLSPLNPWWNCIVLAKKLLWCSDDWSDWDPASIWIPTYSSNYSNSSNSWNSSNWSNWSNWSNSSGNGNAYGVINWNCSPSQEEVKKPSNKEIKKYLEETKKWPVETAFDFLPWTFSEEPDNSLFTSWDSDISVDLDPEALFSWDYDDIIKIDMERVSPFPSWLMDWVTRQIEEIANKLTDFPTLFVVLPDFTWIFNWKWGESSWDEYSSKSSRENDKQWLNYYSKKVNSWIKEAYEFIWSAPLVYVEQETVNISVPWISITELEKTIYSRSATIDQWEEELDNAWKAWSSWAACVFSDPDEQEACVSDNMITNNLSYQVEWLISWLRKNLEVIKSYKEIPEKINGLLNKKQEYLEQILCNIEIVTSILWWRIWENGIRFKAWVELYLLIKAILKSWQLLVDVFIDYEEECHECKNERQDALEREFKLISMLLPKIPVIRFPKWPDIILDLHNIRAWLIVTLPEFSINSKPILLPVLPSLKLPEVPSANLSLNFKLPVLPGFEIPELPDLPSLPSVELPDLPPPPKLPKLLSSIEVIVDIIKLITKAMCILKSSPLHPEWRAWDQIAFLTERSGYLWTDFFDLSLPEFSIPFVDAIKVTTYVNLEFESDFIVELARQIAMPINAFTNDFTNIFDVNLSKDIDFSDVVPSWADANIDVTPEWVDADLWMLKFWEKLSILLAKKVSTDIQHLATVLENKKDESIDNQEFKRLVNKSLASKTITSNPKLDSVRSLWDQVNNMTYSVEDKLIKELKDNNTKKFNALSDIINTEIIKNKELKNELKSYWKIQITKVGFDDWNKIEMYNKTLSKYNDKFFESAKNLVDWKSDWIKDELKESSKSLVESIKTPLQNYSKSNKTTQIEDILSYNEYVDSDLISATTNNNSNSLYANTSTVNSCEQNQSSPYSYVYKWIYILEWNTSYRLFDYLDELDWNEVTKIIDLDNDGDDDLLYFANNQLYLKENLKEKPTKKYVTTNPLVLNSNSNKFYEWSVFYEAINNANEIFSSNWSINFWFSSPTDRSINNFRIWFYTLVDKFLWKNNSNYRPENISENIIDAISSIDDVTINSKSELFIERNNLAYISNVWNLKWVKLKTKEMINIKDNILSNNIVRIIKWTKVYAWWNPFNIKYIFEDNPKEEKNITISKNQNIEFFNTIVIKWLVWDAYVQGTKDVYYEWEDIRKHLNKLLVPGSKITYERDLNKSLGQKYIDIKYYDWSELWIDFSKTSSWELYDLWLSTSWYYIKLNKSNDFYYAKINSFKNNINWTISSQSLLSPQTEADTTSPELNLNSIRIPVFQKKTIDLSSYIYENSWIKDIDRVIVDMDLNADTNNDWNNKNDDDWSINWPYKNKIKVIISMISLKLELWKFDDIFKKKIWVTTIDKNNNIGYKEIDFEVYSPIPEINAYIWWKVDWKINEEITEEPINLYRYRWWVISSLRNMDWTLKSKTESWNYSFDVTSTWSGLNLYRAWEVIWLIDESNWKITLKDLSLKINVLSSSSNLNDLAFPKILINDNWTDIFYQYIQMQWVNKVNVVDDFDKVKDKWIYFISTNTQYYSYYSSPENIDYSPWALSIYRNSDENKTNLFTIFKDWRINTINDSYNLEYVSNEKNWYFKLVDKHFDREIWRLMIISNSDFIMK